MIISKEQRDILYSDGRPTKELIVSYLNPQGGISFLRYPVPPDDMFEWRYSSQRYADPVWRSYDNKYIRKVPVKHLDEMRINEILMSFGSQVNPIFEMGRPITHFFDIETDVDYDGFPDSETVRTPVNTIAITRFPETIVFGRKPLDHPDSPMRIQKKIDEYAPHLIKGYKFTYREFKSEREMLIAWINYVKDIPALSGWNVIDYDYNYLYNRCKKLGIKEFSKLSPTGSFSREKFSIKGGRTFYANVPRHKILYDYLMVYRQWDMSVPVKENNMLDTVAEAVLGIKKVKHNMGFIEFYRDHYDDYVFYNAVDTILVELIDKKIKTADIWLSLTSELKIDLNMAFSTINPAQVVMCDFIYNEKKVIPRKDEIGEKKSYKGAFVWPSRKGIFKHILGLDYASLYPSTMIQFNISPETFLKKVSNPDTYIPADDEILTASGAVYYKNEKGILPRILEVFFAKRKAAKNMRKQADTEYESLKHIYERRTGTRWNE